MGTSLFYLPLQLAAVTLMYFDLRVRTEGFDLAVLANVTPTVIPSALASQVAPSVSTPLITGSELGYFVLLSFLSIGGACLLSMLLQTLFFHLIFFLTMRGMMLC